MRTAPRRTGVRRWRFALLPVVIGLVGISDAQAATVTRPGFTATVGATVAPTQLPRTGGAPVTLTLSGTTSRSPAEAAFTLESVRLQLDRGLTVDTKGLPVCSKRAVEGVYPQTARQKCGAALIGSGAATETNQFPEQAPFTTEVTWFLFNARSGGHPSVLLYGYRQAGSLPPEAWALPIGPVRTPALPVGEGPVATRLSFHARLGRTWRYQGRTHSYLSGRCQTGKLENRVTLQFSDGTTADASSPERCTKRA